MLFPTRIAAVSFIALVSLTGFAAAEHKKFEEPKYKNLALDWCRTWATDCGKPAADMWCKKQGYDNSAGFTKWNDIGSPTRVIGNNQICDQPDCDSFEAITCQRADVEDDAGGDVTHYVKPMAGNRRLDWCLTWATDCGKPAANFYCKTQGHDKAVSFKIASDIGKTRLLKTGEKCTQPDCDGFKYIDCE